MDIQYCDETTHLYPIAPWIGYVGIGGFLFGVAVVIIGFYVNKMGNMQEPFVPYLMVWGAFLMNNILIMAGARRIGHTIAMIQATKELIQEEGDKA